MAAPITLNRILRYMFTDHWAPKTGFTVSQLIRFAYLIWVLGPHWSLTRFLDGKYNWNNNDGGKIKKTHLCNTILYFVAFWIPLLLLLFPTIDFGCSPEPPHWGGPNEYWQSLFWVKIRKKKYIPLQTSFSFITMGYSIELLMHVHSLILCYYYLLLLKIMAEGLVLDPRDLYGKRFKR